KLKTAARSGVKPFGAERGIRIGRSVPEAQIREFEDRYRINLPPEYRLFLLKVQGGGAGPAYGLFDFDQVATFEREDPDEVMLGEFPFTERYNPCDDPSQARYFELEGKGEATDEDHRKREEAVARETAGTLVLCHEECGYYHFLVVKGPAYGQMW